MSKNVKIKIHGNIILPVPYLTMWNLVICHFEGVSEQSDENMCTEEKESNRRMKESTKETSCSVLNIISVIKSSMIRCAGV